MPVVKKTHKCPGEKRESVPDGDHSAEHTLTSWPSHMAGFGNEPIILTDADEFGRVGAATLISHKENHWTVLLSNNKYNV